MERSLTVLFPVKNLQATLASMVVETLEVASELSGQFEVLIVDDGSTDATAEVAHELTRCYPQVRLVGHNEPLGLEAAIRTGLTHSRGEMVFVREEKSASPLGSRLVARSSGKRPHGPSRPARPNYLTRLKKFALGE